MLNMIRLSSTIFSPPQIPQQRMKSRLATLALCTVFYAALFLAFGTTLRAQADADSLRRFILPATDDTLKVRRLTELAKTLANAGKYDSALAAAHWANVLAARLGEKRGVVDALYQRGRIYYFQGDYSTSLNFFNQSLSIAEQIGYQQGISDNLNNIGGVYQSQNQYSQALKYHFKSLTVNEELGDKRGIARSLNNIGVIYDSQSQYPKALEFHLKSLKISEELGNKKGIANSLNNIGGIYISLSERSQALDYYLRSLKIREELDDRRGTATSLHNIGRIHHEQSKYNQALEYHLKSLEIREEIGDQLGIAESLLAIGLVCTDIGEVNRDKSQYSKALEYYSKSLNISKEIGSSIGIATSLHNISNVYSLQNKFNQALISAQDALEIYKKVGALEAEIRIQFLLSTIHAGLGNYKAAYAAQSEHYALKDSLFNADNAKRLAALQADYDAQKRTAKEKLRAAEVRHKAELAAQERDRITQFQYAAIAGVVLLVLALALAGRRLNAESAWGQRLGRFVSFAAVVMLVEFALLFLDPTLDRLTGGAPLWRMAANVGIAVVIAPLHGLVEARLRALRA